MLFAVLYMGFYLTKSRIGNTKTFLIQSTKSEVFTIWMWFIPNANELFLTIIIFYCSLKPFYRELCRTFFFFNKIINNFLMKTFNILSIFGMVWWFGCLILIVINRKLNMKMKTTKYVQKNLEPFKKLYGLSTFCKFCSNRHFFSFFHEKNKILTFSKIKTFDIRVNNPTAGTSWRCDCTIYSINNTILTKVK